MDGAALRQLMGSFPQGVTVVTTPGAEPRGITVSSFISVSLDPPLVLVSIARSARAHEAIEREGAYAVNILAEDQGALSEHFARQGVASEDQFAGIGVTLSPGGCPVLSGALGHLDCRVVGTFVQADHTLFVGEVQLGTVTREARPLVFYSRGYWGVGEEVHRRA